MFLLQGNKGGEAVYYTGQAGPGWLNADKAKGFQYGKEAAEAKAAFMNKYTALHGMSFYVVGA